MVSTSLVSARRILQIRRSLLGMTGILAGASAPAVVASSVLAQSTTVAQAAPAPSPVRRNPRRADLEAGAANLEQRARSEKSGDKRSAYLAQAGVIRARLSQGDFQSGHRILLFVVGDSALSDTFTVRSDQKLQLPNMPEMSLAGVLDSELQGYLQTQLAQYIRNPAVRAQALLRVSVSGDVANPGFYSIRTDTPVSDVIMNAGGPSTTADMNKAVLRRGRSVVVKRDGIQEAFRSELTMSDIGARPGDELFVPAKPTSGNWTKIAAATASITGIVWSIVYIVNR